VIIGRQGFKGIQVSSAIKVTQIFFLLGVHAEDRIAGGAILGCPSVLI
jgi:hypothetical protein